MSVLNRFLHSLALSAPRYAQFFELFIRTWQTNKLSTIHSIAYL